MYIYNIQYTKNMSSLTSSNVSLTPQKDQIDQKDKKDEKSRKTDPSRLSQLYSVIYKSNLLYFNNH